MPRQKKGKAAVLPSAPAYTFGTKAYRNLSEDAGPAPGDYRAPLSSSQHLSSRGTGFGSSCRSRTPDNGTPSPLEYKLSLSNTNHSSAAYSLASRRGEEPHRLRTPGPGQYDVQNSQHAVKPAAAAYTISTRPASSREAERFPGPDEYDGMAGLRPRTSAPAYTIGTRYVGKGTSSSTEISPGPGAYSPGSTTKRAQSPAYSFGGSRPSRSFATDVPGPGAYSSTDCISPKQAAWTIPQGRSGREVQHEDKPGPGTYFAAPSARYSAGHSADSGRRSSPAFQFAGRVNDKPDDQSPAPSAYDADISLVRTSSPSFTFRGVDVRSKAGRFLGPGHYEPQHGFALTKLQDPAITISQRMEQPNSREWKPGPTDYAPQRHRRGGGVSMKWRHELHQHQPTPGPQDYSGQLPSKGHAFSFGLRPAQKGAEITPGPGAYEVHESTIGVAC